MPKIGVRVGSPPGRRRADLPRWLDERGGPIRWGQGETCNSSDEPACGGFPPGSRSRRQRPTGTESRCAESHNTQYLPLLERTRFAAVASFALTRSAPRTRSVPSSRVLSSCSNNKIRTGVEAWCVSCQSGSKIEPIRASRSRLMATFTGLTRTSDQLTKHALTRWAARAQKIATRHGNVSSCSPVLKSTRSRCPA